MSLKLYSAKELAVCVPPEREWLVADWIPMKAVTLVTGDGGVGKSNLLLSLSISCATGSEWVGMQVKKGSVIYLSAEDDVDELHRRTINALDKACNFVEALDVFFIDPTQINYFQNNNRELTPFGVEIQKFIVEIKPRLVVFDTAPNFFLGNENERREVTAFISSLNRIAAKNKCAIVLLTHPSKHAYGKDSYSGSTAWNGSVRSRISLTANGEHKVKMKRDKTNYSKVGETVELMWLEGRLTRISHANNSNVSNAAKEQYLMLLRHHLDRGIEVSPYPSKTFAPKVFSNHPEAGDYTSIAFQQAQDALLKENVIEIVNVGPPSKKRDRIRLPTSS
jgi:archaellum biogenesis ATPase FlaH